MKKLEALRFVDILETGEDVQMRVREWRNQQNIRRYMYTDHVISDAEHRRWLEGLRGNDSVRVFVVFFEDQPVGVVSLNAIDRRHRKADWAFYLKEGLRGLGLGSRVEYQLIELAFGEFGLEKLNCEVLATNPSVIRLHKKFGFVEEGVRRGNVIKDGERVDVCLLGLLAAEWPAARERVEKVLRGR